MIAERNWLYLQKVQDHAGGKSVRKVGVNVTDPPQLTVKAVQVPLPVASQSVRHSARGECAL